MINFHFILSRYTLYLKPGIGLGLPLHTQGRCLNLSFTIVGVRFPSAYAEKIFLFLQRPAHSSDHPHTRGENYAVTDENGVARGSPPHTRGKFQKSDRAFRDVRITPAYAGKIIPPCSRSGGVENHPRIRGENVSSLCSTRCSRGSPPHTRGKSRSPPHGKGGDRITPAYAGKIEAGHARGQKAEDHPRIRGENGVEHSLLFGRPGSPPHTRGKLPYPAMRPTGEGITPAYAGKIGQTRRRWRM